MDRVRAHETVCDTPFHPNTDRAPLVHPGRGDPSSQTIDIVAHSSRWYACGAGNYHHALCSCVWS